MDKFLIIDGNSIMNRAFYGLGSARMTSSILNIHTGAIYGFLNTYWMIKEKVNPDYIAVAFDVHAPTFRHKMYDDYKGTRKGMPEELIEQMPVIKDVLRAMNITIFELAGYEADDILGTIAKKNEQNDIFTYILTGDRDSYQLISDKTSIIMPSTKAGKTEYTFYTPELLYENFKIEPYQVIHIKSLMGDSSDNIPGVKGIGEKTAYSLIWENTTLENIYENIDTINVSAKVKEKLLNDRQMANLSKELATIDVNIPLSFEYGFAKVMEPNKEEIYELFKKLEFTKFLSKFDFSNISSKHNDEKQDSNKNSHLFELSNYTIIDNLNYDDNIQSIIDTFTLDKVSYLLNITSKNNFTENNLFKNKDIFAIYNHSKNECYIVNLSKINKEQKEDLFIKFANSDCLKLGYNLKQDMLYIFNNYSDTVINFKYDVMIANYLFDSSKNNYNIEDYIYGEYGISFIQKSENIENAKQLSIFDLEEKEEKNETVFLDDNDIKNLSLYLKGIFFSYENSIEKLKSLQMYDLFDTIEMPLAETLAYMEHTGMYIDIDMLNIYDEEITKGLNILEEKIYKISEEKFNINSTQQLATILFEKLKLPVVKKTKNGYSTNKEVLEELEDKHPIIPLILEYRQLIKLKTTYVDGLREKISDDGRIHTTFMQTVASTGRISSVEPNLQNIPVRLELGRKIRSFFTGENGTNIIDADYSQIELRVLADVSCDENMIDAFNSDIDIHKVTASQVFGVDIDDVTGTMRSHAKAVNFGIVYGISQFGLAKNIGCTRKDAAEYIESYLEKYSGIKKFMDDIVIDAKENGYVSTLFGRRRYIPEIDSKNKVVEQFGKRVAMNTPIQGTAADIIKLAMNKIYIKIKLNNLKSRLIMQVHDELLIEVYPGEEEKIKELMYDSMENVIKLKVPLKIDLNIGKSWYDAK